MSIYHIDSSLQVDIDVPRAPSHIYIYIGNMDVAYAIAICSINTPKVHMCLEYHCSRVVYICTYIYIYIDGLAFSLLLLIYAAMIWMVRK